MTPLVARLVLRLAPEAFRREHGGEIVRTIADACATSYDRGGWPAFIGRSVVEWTDVLRMAVRARLGRRLSVTSGSGPSRSSLPGKERFHVSLNHDVRLALRSLLASRAETTIAVLTLALGIGINTAVFSILDSILWRPVPFRDAARFVELANFNVAKKFTYSGWSRQLLMLWRDQTDLFDRVEAFEPSSLLYEDASGAEMISGATVTPGLLAVLGVPPREGRTFVVGDGRDGSGDFVVISDRFWRARLNRDPAAVGRRIMLGGRPRTVVGIMPATFRFPSDLQDLWLPYDIDQPSTTDEARRTFVPFARLQPGLTPERIGAEVTARGSRLSEAAGGSPDNSAAVMSLGDSVDDKTRRSLVVLGGAVAFLLLIVCANVANLALSRSAARTRDFAVRAALGASRFALLREALVEHLLTGALGAIGGLAVAYVALRATLAVLPDAMTSSTLNAIDLDERALLFTMGIAVITSLGFGLAPAFMASRASVTDILGRESRSASGSPFARRARSVLVIAEVSLAIVLLVGAALMTRSFVKLAAVGAGFEASGLVSLRLGLPAAGYSDPALRDRLARDVVDRVRQLPFVTAATIGTLPSETGAIAYGAIEVANAGGEPGPPQLMPLHFVAANYFSAVGLPIIAGRTFRDDDPAGSVVVSAHFAQMYWPAQSALNGQFRVAGGAWRTIVGVAGEAKSLRTGADSQGFEFYYPLGDPADAFHPTSASRAVADYRTILIRTSNPGATAANLSEAVHAIDRRVIVWNVALVEHLFADAVARPRVVLLMMSVFAVFGLILAAAGIYGVLSCLVSQRLREIGIRLAIGASPREIGRVIVGSGIALTAIGLAIGIALALGLVRVMQSLLFEVEPSDPVSIAAVTVLLFATATLAAWRPARRAMRVDPVSLLREQ